MKVIVTGGRDFNNYEMLTEVLDKLEIEEIISGDARGANSLSVKYGTLHKIFVKYYSADWDTSAGFRRNTVMAKYGGMSVAFWDERSGAQCT